MNKPIDAFDANDEFFKLVVEALILCAAMKKFEMTSLHGVPCQRLAPDGQDSWMQTKEERTKLLEKLVTELLDSFFSTSLKKIKDKIRSYAANLLSFYCEYCDAIKEGDGVRVLRCW